MFEEIRVSDCEAVQSTGDFVLTDEKREHWIGKFEENFNQTGLMGFLRYLESHGCDEELCFELASELANVAGKYSERGDAIDDEIDKAICTIFETDPKEAAKKRPKFSPERLAETIDGNGVTQENLAERLGGDEKTTDSLEVIKKLFADDHIIAYAELSLDSKTWHTKKVGEIDSLDGMRYICPNRRSDYKGLTKRGKKSKKCSGNDPERPDFLVFESDKVNQDQQAAFIYELDKIAPVSLVLDSGGKSLHAWVDVRSASEDVIDKLINYGCLHGSDSNMATMSQFFRMPWGVREDGTPQNVIVCRPTLAGMRGINLKNLEKTKSEKEGFDLSGLPIPMTGAEMRDLYIEPVEEVMKSVIGRGEKLMLAGSSKAGKTWGLMALAEAISTGGNFLGIECVKGDVLFLNFEINRKRMRERIDRFSQLDDVVFVNLAGKLCTWDDIKKAIEKTYRVTGRVFSTIVIDPIYKMLGDCDENSNGDIARLLHNIGEIAIERDVMVAYSHHFSKGNKANTESIDRASGAGAWARDPDALLTLTQHEHEDENHLVLESTLRHYRKLDKSVWRFDFPYFVPTDEDPDKLRKHGGSNSKGSYKDAVAIVNASPQGIKNSDLLEQLELNTGAASSTVARWVKKAEKEGLILAEGKAKSKVLKPLGHADDLM